MTAVRIEGPAPSAEHRCQALRALFKRRGETEELHGRNSAAFWAEVGDVAALLPVGEGALWRVSVPPAAGAEVAARIRAGTDAEILFDWGGGLLWVATEASQAAESAVRTAYGMQDGHATLVAAPAEFRRSVPVFQPKPGPLAALEARLRAQFDPKGILNPGRLGAEA